MNWIRGQTLSRRPDSVVVNIHFESVIPKNFSFEPISQGYSNEAQSKDRQCLP